MTIILPTIVSILTLRNIRILQYLDGDIFPDEDVEDIAPMALSKDGTIVQAPKVRRWQ